jgi:hypothetical protein
MRALQDIEQNWTPTATSAQMTQALPDIPEKDPAILRRAIEARRSFCNEGTS